MFVLNDAEFWAIVVLGCLIGIGIAALADTIYKEIRAAIEQAKSDHRFREEYNAMKRHSREQELHNFYRQEFLKDTKDWSGTNG